MQAQLSDGSAALGVHLSTPCALHGCVSVAGNLWTIAPGSNVITIRDARTGEVISKVDVLEEAVAAAGVSGRVWVSTVSGKIYVFDSDKTMLGGLQNVGAAVVRRFFALGEHTLLSSTGGKDVTVWDAAQFTATRTFVGSTSGEVVTDVALAKEDHSAFFIASTHTLRCWLSDGTCVAEVKEGAASVAGIVVDRKPLMWAAQKGWIAVYGLTTGGLVASFQREATLPAAGVRQLVRTDRQHIVSLDAVGQVTVWAAAAATPHPLRSFTVTTALGLATAEKAFCFVAAETRATVVWTVSDGRAVVWTDEQDTKGAADEDTTRDLQHDEILFLRRKIKYLESIGTVFRQKAGILFRERGIGASAASGGGGNTPLPGGGGTGLSPRGARPSTPGRDARPLGRDDGAGAHHHSYAQLVPMYNELDRNYARALENWDHDNQAMEPLPDARDAAARARAGASTAKGVMAVGTDAGSALASGEVADFTEYWKQRYRECAAEYADMRKEYDHVAALFQTQSTAPGGGGAHSGDIDVRRAQHICQLIKDKNELKERERILSDDVARLRARLRDFNTPLASRGPAEEDADRLKELNAQLREELAAAREARDAAEAKIAEGVSAHKHNQVLKQRVRKLRADLDEAQLQLSESTTALQHDAATMVASIAALQRQCDERRAAQEDAEQAKATAELECVRCRGEIEKLRATAEAAHRTLAQRDDVDRASHAEVRNEIGLLCAALDERDKRFAELQAAFNAQTADLRDRAQQLAEGQARLRAKGAECGALHQRLAQLDAIVNDRKTYARVVGELQGRMEMAVEELRRSFAPAQLAENLADLETRLSGLFSLDSQLRQKDDCIAAKDDQLQQLREHARRVEERIDQVSSVFLQMPKSVQEVEMLMVECDEYRRRLGMDAETQEMVQIRLLELQAKRRAGEPIPPHLDVHGGSLLPVGSGGGGGAGGLGPAHIREASAAMGAISAALASGDVAGRIGAPLPLPAAGWQPTASTTAAPSATAPPSAPAPSADEDAPQVAAALNPAQRRKDLAAQLGAWKDAFAASNGRAPTIADIKCEPAIYAVFVEMGALMKASEAASPNKAPAAASSGFLTVPGTSGAAPMTAPVNLAALHDPNRPLRVSGDWREVREKDTGKVYFYDKATSRTTRKIEETPFANMPLPDPPAS